MYINENEKLTFLSFLKLTFLPPKKFSPKIEKDFELDYANKNADSRKFVILLSFVVWGLFYIWDYVHIQTGAIEKKNIFIIYTLRISVSLGLLISFFLLISKYQNNEKYITYTILFCSLLAFNSLLYMATIIKFPYNFFFYVTGMMLILVFIFILMRLFSRPIIFNNIFNFITSIIFLKDIFYADNLNLINVSSWYYYFSTLSLLLTFMIVGNAVSIQVEISARLTFLKEKELIAAEKETETKTNALINLKEQMRIDAEKENHDKSKFLADAAHDLKQPMQALTNLLEVTEHYLRIGEIEKAKEFLVKSKSAAKISRHSLNSILDLSRIETGYVQADLIDFEINKFLGNIIEQFQSEAHRKGLNLRFKPSKFKNLFVRSDPHLLERVLSNIISNALKYSKDKSDQVLISITNIHSRVRIDIIDQGIGIDKNHWEMIFSPFIQLANPERDRNKGYGLGLSIVGAILNILDNHSLQMNSEVGKGSRFSIYVPLGLENVEENQIILGNKSNVTPYNFEGLYLIYIEDDLLVKKSLEVIFDMHRILYRSFASYDELKAHYETIERYPDLVITDFKLPQGKSAHDVYRLIDENSENTTPLIILTGEVSELNFGKAENITILRKPIEPRTLLEVISKQALMM